MSKTASSSSAPAQPQLRPPFKFAVSVASSVAGAVNGTIDGTVAIVGKSANAFLRNSYVEYATNGFKAFEGKVKPYTAKTQPYVQPLVPYINKATPYIPPVLVAVFALASIPVFFTAAIIALFTAPIWLTVGFFTAFIWIPIAIFSFFASAFLAFVAAVRYLSQPSGQAILDKWWKAISSTPSGKKIFFVTAKPTPAIGAK